ncbi:MAG TPA: excalibur calcium-binding domain-containing protein [Pseudonocardia sp.]|jgi:hypothetical protein|uniref:excalibur calcium-binding domain-containing protein n=1 Tax=Pseudonocardia sp. TaxID=60912 RepID=UPI002B4B7C41|nr:excalibur calcium-binding domain-containing protein [Pseudonocardia sp.]HLU54059.1 excalibur calcium-binding domain-containing protein [Pseudonocardia sp.]
MPRPAKVGLSILGSLVAIIVFAGIVGAGEPAATAASSATSTVPTTAPTTTTPAATTSSAPVAATPDERFAAAVAATGELLEVGRSICGSIGVPGVTHAGLVDELAASRWGAALAEAVVTSAEVNLCPDRRFVAAAPQPLAQPAPAQAAPAPAAPARPEPREQGTRRPETRTQQAPEPKKAPSKRSFKNCTEARAAGAAPLYAGEPGYRGALDRDKDGVACE